MNARLVSTLIGSCLGAVSAAVGHAAEPAAPRPDLAWVTPEIIAPGVSFHTFESAAAKATVSYHLFTPAAYGREPDRRFPVVYWLHGSGGGLPGIPKVAARFAAAIEAGKAPPCLVVFVNGLQMGMYVDWSNGQAPMETIIVHELRSFIDARWRTLAKREGRLLDGFSMGGYGAARFGFRYPELFRTVSMMGAGPMQEFLTTVPRASKAQAEELLRNVYGGSQAGFQAVSPRRYARENAARLAGRSRLRLVIGDRDETFENNRDFHLYLSSLGIPHDWIVLPGVGHDPFQVLTALGDRQWAFYREAFG
jgi:S-formylglutathione hydrolase FrmB